MASPSDSRSVLSKLVIEANPRKFAVCRMRSFRGVNPEAPCTFMASTGSELSLVCPEDWIPADTERIEAGWRMFRVCGTLDFALVGILAAVASALAEKGIPLFAVSTFDTDYFLVKEPSFEGALAVLREAGAHVKPLH